MGKAGHGHEVQDIVCISLHKASHNLMPVSAASAGDDSTAFFGTPTPEMRQQFIVLSNPDHN